jgi:hypothetical protein
LETVFAGTGAHVTGTSLTTAAIPVMSEAILWKTAAAALTHPAAAEKIINAMQILARLTPYAGSGAYYIHKEAHRDHTKPSHNVEDIKKQVEELQKSMHLGGFAPAPKETSPPAPGPQSSAKPVWTHVYNASTGAIEAV